MPSPFPGMDPYLENPVTWRSLHHQLISELEAELNHQLRPKYFAGVVERVYLSDQNDPGLTLNFPEFISSFRRRSKNLDGLGGVAVIEPVEVRAEEEVHEARIEIMDTHDRSIVRVVEILCPMNKVKGAFGRDTYLAKRRQIFDSASHMVEIDLLREGLRVPFTGIIPPYDYLVHISKSLKTRRRNLPGLFLCDFDCRFWKFP